MKKKIDKNKIKTWFVTGASSGIGHEMCFQLLERGYNVVAVSRRVPDFQHENALCLSVDVTNVESVKAAVEKSIVKFGKVDVLLNSAGISSYLSFEEESEEKMRKVMETNFWGSYNTCHELIGHFRQNENGTIINITSECGLMPRAFGAAYCSSKYALEGLTSVISREAYRFCRVMAVEPAFFPNTEIGKDEVKGSQLSAYRGIPWVKTKKKFNDKNNKLPVAVKFIIDEVECQDMQRRLMLGKSIIDKVATEIESLNCDLKKSKSRAYACSVEPDKFKKALKKFVEKVFSVKNSANKRHKIVTVLGLRMKFRRKNNAKG